MKRRWLIALGLVGGGLLALHLSFPLPYVYRVFVYQDAGYEDIHRFPARVIAPSDAPEALAVSLGSHAREVIEQHPDVDAFDALLAETDTTAFLVAHRGELVEERYLLGNDRKSPQNTFSVSKSFTSALVGLAVRDGLIEIAAPITRYLPELAERDARFAEITVEHLLDMRSGIRFSDDIEFPILNSDNPLIYYHPDLESVVLERTEIAEAPGSFRYNNYNPPLLGLILLRVTGLSPGHYLERELWQPLGAAGAAGWTTDDHGLERMESGFHARARDLVRFGLLYLADGQVDGRPVVPRRWVEASTDLAESLELESYNGRTWGYRAGWWIMPRPEGPSDFCAIGRFGQFIYVSPQYDAVFIRNGPDRGDWGDGDWTELFYFVAERL